MTFKTLSQILIISLLVLGISHPCFSKTIEIIRKVEILGIESLPKKNQPKITALKTKKGQEKNKKKLQEDLETLYASGYFQEIKLHDKQVTKGIEIIFKVKENPKIKKIQFKGRTKIKAKTLYKTLKNKKNEVFNIQYLEEDIKAIESLYHKKGYDLFRIETAYLENGNTLIFKFSEGWIEDIRYTGIKKTKDFIISRELALKKGDVFNSSSLRKDRNQLVKLGFFSSVSSPKIAAVSETKNQASILYQFQERKFNFLDIGIEQLRDEDGLAGFIQVKTRNTFLYSDSMIVKTQIETKEKLKLRSYQLAYKQPWFLNQYNFSFGLSLWTDFRREPLSGESNSLYNKRIGADLTIGIPIDRETLSLYLKGKTENVSPDQSSQFTAYKINSFSTKLSYDDRLSIINPKRGNYLNLSIERGGSIGGLSLGGLQFTRWFIDTATFHPLSNDSVLGLRTFYGQFHRDQITTIKTFGSEEFPLGGGNSIRGIPTLSYIGPNRILANIEYRKDLNKEFQGVLFYDTGAVYEHNDPPKLSDFKSGVGIGLRYITGFIPFRLDLAWGEDTILHFNIGHSF